jgi:hypothetical protein
MITCYESAATRMRTSANIEHTGAPPPDALRGTPARTPSPPGEQRELASLLAASLLLNVGEDEVAAPGVAESGAQATGQSKSGGPGSRLRGIGRLLSRGKPTAPSTSAEAWRWSPRRLGAWPPIGHRRLVREAAEARRAPALLWAAKAVGQLTAVCHGLWRSRPDESASWRTQSPGTHR